MNHKTVTTFCLETVPAVNRDNLEIVITSFLIGLFSLL